MATHNSALRARMTRRRWIADEVSANQAALTGAHADHLIRVLRVRVGQEFDIAAGSAVHRGRVASVASASAVPPRKVLRVKGDS